MEKKTKSFQKKKSLELRPIKETTQEYESIEALIKRVFLQLVYRPLLKDLNISTKKLKNDSTNGSLRLLEAIASGRVTFSQGVFRGKFSAQISKELRNLGAKWDRNSATYRLTQVELPYEIRAAITASSATFIRKMEIIDRKLAQILPEQLIEKIKVSDMFDKSLWKVDKEFQETLKNITVAPKLSAEQRAKIAQEWQQNMDLWIKDFSEKEILSLRKSVRESTFAGNRYESLVKGIEESYGVTERKAKFLARQETNLLMAKFKETRYTEAGIHEYKWRCVSNPKDKTPNQHTPGNVRYSHGILDGKIFKWNNPPVTTAPGDPERRNNPGQDYNCLPEWALVSFHGSVNKAFRRFHCGKLTELITDNGMIINSTANHPILTDRGWIAMDKVNIGDNVFSTQNESFFTKEMKRKNMKPSVEDVYNALFLCGEISSDTLSESDFHNDAGQNKNVDIVSVNRELILNSIASAYQELSHFLFERANAPDSVFSPIQSLLKAISSTFSDLIRLQSELLFILETQTSHAQNACFRSRTDMDSSLNEPLANRATCNSVFMRDSELTHPILVILNSLLIEGTAIMGRSLAFKDADSECTESFAKEIGIDADSLADLDKSKISGFIKPLRIVNKVIRDFSGHVYNFETQFNWYLSAEVILHNCRCFARPIVTF